MCECKYHWVGCWWKSDLGTVSVCLQPKARQQCHHDQSVKFTNWKAAAVSEVKPDDSGRLGLTSGRVVSAKPCCGDTPLYNKADGFASDFFRLYFTVKAALVCGVRTFTFLATSASHRLYVFGSLCHPTDYFMSHTSHKICLMRLVIWKFVYLSIKVTQCEEDNFKIQTNLNWVTLRYKGFPFQVSKMSVSESIESSRVSEFVSVLWSHSRVRLFHRFWKSLCHSSHSVMEGKGTREAFFLDIFIVVLQKSH